MIEYYPVRELMMDLNADGALRMSFSWENVWTLMAKHFGPPRDVG
jgi:hypothetical protein